MVADILLKSSDLFDFRGYGSPNLWLTNADVDVAGDKINVTIHSADLNGTVNITLYKVDKETGLLSDSKDLQTSIAKKSTASVNITWTLTDAAALNIYIDKNNLFPSDDKNDNFVYRVIVQDRPSAYLSVNTTNPDVDSLIETYLEQYVARVPTTNQAEFVISVGRKTPEFLNSNPGFWNGDDGGIFAYGKPDYAPYAGIVGRVSYSSKPTILVFGNRMEGMIASVKKLVSARSLYFADPVNHAKAPVVVDGMDVLGLEIHSILGGFTNYSSPAFLKAATNILFDNAYDIAIKPVKTLATTSYQNNTILRLMNVNSDFSAEFKDAITNISRPVVLSRGLWSDLFTWKGLGRELVAGGRDAWLIEITGGPTTECPSCPNYDFDDMIDFYFPALIAGVQKYSGKNSLDYVGFSNGCRTALSSLEKYQSTGKNNAGYYFDYGTGQYLLTNLSVNPVSRFVGVGCPGAFNGTSANSELISAVGLPALAYLENAGVKHVASTSIINRLVSECIPSGIFSDASPECAEASAAFFIGTEGKVSINLLQDYFNWIKYDSDDQPGQNLNVDKITLINGYNRYEPKEDTPDTGSPIYDLFGAINDLIDFLQGVSGTMMYDLNDDIVILNDQLSIFDATNTSDEIGWVIPGASHSGLVTESSDIVNLKIKEGIKD